MKLFTNLKKHIFLLFFWLSFISTVSAQSSYFFYSLSDDPWTFDRRGTDGNNPLTIYTPALYQINHSAVDGSINKVYFYESISNKIFKSDYDGSNRTTVLTGTGRIGCITSGNGYLYYANSDDPWSVRRCNSDGSNDILIYVNPSYGSVLALAFDATNNYLYCYEGNYDGTNNRIFRTSPNGSNFTTVYNNSPVITSLSAGAGYMFFSYTNDPWTFNRRNSDGTSEIMLYEPPTGTVMKSAYDADINKLIFYDNNVNGVKIVYKSDIDGTNRTAIYSGFTQTIVSLASPTTRNVGFTDGGSFTQSITPNSTNQALGQFKLTGSSSGALLTSASIRLDNARTGLSNLKLWSSTDATFGGDTQLGSSITTDPGDGNAVTFSGFSSTISTSGTYYFLTADIASGATGTVQGVIVQNNSLSLSGGVLSSTISNAVISNGTSPLPVKINSFIVEMQNTNVLLMWQTATEVNNYGFSVERKIGIDENWVEIGFVEGHGNSNSPKEYLYVDSGNLYGDINYRLKQIDNNGDFEFSDIVVISLVSPKDFILSQNYPNPFNPSTMIKYGIPVQSNVRVEIFDMLGQSVGVLVNQDKSAGFYETTWNAANLPSGIYLISIKANGLSSSKNFTQVKKALLLK